MKKIKVFLDTEFTAFLKPHLISVGMVTEDWRQLYLELPHNRATCSEFVQSVVLSLLNQDPEAACALDQVAQRVNAWLAWIRPIQGEVIVCFDYSPDWELLASAMNYQIPAWVTPRLLKSAEVNMLMLEDYWLRNPNEREHHALHDAKALRYAFREKH